MLINTGRCRRACIKATWLFWDLQLRQTFRRRLHGVQLQSSTWHTSLLRYVDRWRWMDGLYRRKHISTL